MGREITWRKEAFIFQSNQFLSLQISNHTASTIEVKCEAGFSGGLAQHFVMEVFETTSNNTQALVASNWTSDPSSGVAVRGLLPDYNYIVSVRAVNERGSSSPVYVGGKTETVSKPLPRQVDESRAPLLVVLVGILVSLAVVGACFTAALALRRARERSKMRAAAEAAREAAEIEASLRDAAEARSSEQEMTTTVLNNLIGGDTAVAAAAAAVADSDATSLPLLERNSDSPPVRIIASGNNGNAFSVSLPDETAAAAAATAARVGTSPDRKVSFRDASSSSTSTATTTSSGVPICSRCGGRQTMRPRQSLVYRGPNIDGKVISSGGGGGGGGRGGGSVSNVNGDLAGATPASAAAATTTKKVNNNVGLPVERAVVRTFSVEKMRPICPTCNPSGGTPYPSESQTLDEIVSQSTALLNQAAR